MDRQTGRMTDGGRGEIGKEIKRRVAGDVYACVRRARISQQ